MPNPCLHTARPTLISLFCALYDDVVTRCVITTDRSTNFIFLQWRLFDIDTPVSSTDCFNFGLIESFTFELIFEV